MREIFVALKDAPAENRSVPMTLKQVGQLFGYSSGGGIKKQTERIGLNIPKDERGGCTFRMEALTSEQRKTYDSNLKSGMYRSKWEPQPSNK